MRNIVYYLLMLMLGYAWYKFGQKLLRQGHRDENDEPTTGIFGPFGFLLSAALTCYLVFGALRALIRGEVSCLGRSCSGQVYTLAAHPSDYWSNMFFMIWIVFALIYALYVTFIIWSRD
ncbi:hypothetical protein M2375_000904 [Comamonas sp. BIGb0152]|uniref:hypothetical protein n=1 Tax=Comamonas sp. BIGb0152 TaxID=2940601 RepID=UPI00216A9B3B|nr:hypothetical protein [Comamonas sp. BIGb0152]MCS4292698.1 hypothetical protein [Comamonas sp. BIGb0152]